MTDTVPVVVYTDGAQRVGLVVGQIVDIVQEPVAARSAANRPGILFTAILHGRVTEFLDVTALIEATTTDKTPATA